MDRKYNGPNNRRIMTVWTQQLYTDVGEAVRKAREEAGLSLKALSRETGVSESTIHNCEYGQNVSLPVLVRIAEALDTTLDALVPVTLMPRDEEEVA